MDLITTAPTGVDQLRLKDRTGPENENPSKLPAPFRAEENREAVDTAENPVQQE